MRYKVTISHFAKATELLVVNCTRTVPKGNANQIKPKIQLFPKNFKGNCTLKND